jgi:hypothetical protein
MTIGLVVGNALTPTVVRLWVGEVIASECEFSARPRQLTPPSVAATTMFDDARTALVCVQGRSPSRALVAGISRTRIALLPTASSPAKAIHRR